MAEAQATTLAWTWTRFEGLGLQGLYQALALRAEVFVVEQRCAYQDVDGLDPQSWHLLGHDAAGRLMAYLRVVDPGLKYDEPSIGRVVTAPQARGTGAGQALMREGLARCQAAWPGRAVRISAQAHLQRFYGALGFEPVGDTYLEDDIPHIEMLCPAPHR
ncbi:GNAT family N-acetyltransferase [Aquincola tertiaricarbonis]|uniref:GNAT family N-acetyltransferase n=1 Tax=Aquincola tertiaricarbonis TaxID=391953 RepID=A0ABY4SGG9_AQUTE|nr:GNAT family N-acetyltransferase [Aquincola tertiaricarbonis]URI11222.1 GNAT family N-acetyltransferase [Aquincola tertiaricarbonis]